MRKEIETLRKEAETALRILYALKQFKSFLTGQDEVDTLNKNAYFWIQYELAITSTLFIRIRRIYESKGDTFNFQKFINMCVNNVDQFSLESLRKRKMAGSQNAHEWIEEYLEGKHEATEQDFHSLSKLVRENSKKMKGIYTSAASKIYAHAIHTGVSEITTINADLSLEEIEVALLSVWHCYEQIWQMFENGLSPTFKIGVYRYEQEVYDSVKNQLFT